MGKAVPSKSPVASSLLNISRLVMLLMISGIYYYVAPSGQPMQLGFVLVAMAVFTVNHMLYFRIRAFWWLMGLETAIVTAFGLVFLGETTLYQILFAILGVSVTIHTSNRRLIRSWIGVAILAWGGIEWTEYQVLGTFDPVSNLLDLGFFLFTCVVGSLVRFYREAQVKLTGLYGELDSSHSRLQEAHEQLGTYARQVELLTATRERNHIAREIHDTVGHTMTSLLVQLQVARKLQDKDPVTSKEALLRCEELARSALQEVRLSVRALQEEGEAVSLLDSLRKLLAEFSELSQVETELQVQGPPSYVTTSLEPVIYRIVQEALTNAKRHGQATSAKVNLCCYGGGSAAGDCR